MSEELDEQDDDQKEVYGNALRAVLDYCFTEREFRDLIIHVKGGGDKEDSIIWQAAILAGVTSKVDQLIEQKLEEANIA